MPSTLIRARVEKKRAADATRILARIGLKPADAVNMLFAQIVADRGLPLRVHTDETAELLADPALRQHLASNAAGEVDYLNLKDLTA